MTLRAAAVADVPVLAAWARRPHVIRATSDDPASTAAFDRVDWAAEVASAWSDLLIAEVDGRPIGMLQIAAPALDPDAYWGEIGPGERSLDIWIGETDMLGQGFGTEMMRLAIERCFADPAAEAIVIDPLASNVDAIRFYRRLGFTDVGPRRFDDDQCLVMRLARPQGL